jgi:hypothetical protein
MTICVKDRTITIDDGLAKEYERQFFEPVNEKTLLAYFGQEDEDVIGKYSSLELGRLAEKYIKDDLSVWRTDV